ncbi:hypothetical protein D3C75_1169590 [compost metagenome]
MAGTRLPVSGEGPAPYADGAEISIWAKDAAKQLSGVGIFAGREGGRFAPAAQITRAEAAVVVKRLLQAVKFIN